MPRSSSWRVLALLAVVGLFQGGEFRAGAALYLLAAFGCPGLFLVVVLVGGCIAALFRRQKPGESRDP